MAVAQPVRRGDTTDAGELRTPNDTHIRTDASISSPTDVDTDRSHINGTKRPRQSRSRNVGRKYSSDAIALRRAIARSPSAPVAIDLETKGLHPHATTEAAIGACIVEAAGVTYIFRELPDWWPELLTDEATPKILHNAKFDLMWMIEFCPSPDGQIVARNIQDTMLKSQLAHDYRTKSGAAKAGRPQLWKGNDLKQVLDEHLGVQISKSIDHETTDWTGPWSDEMTDYMLEDISYLAPLNAALDKQIQSEGQERASWIEQNCTFATAWMTLNGIKPDVEAWREAIHGKRDADGNLVRDEEGQPILPGWKEQHHSVLEELLELWPGVENFNSPVQLVRSSTAVLGGKLANTKKATLKQLAGSFPAVAKLLEQRHLATRLKNWGPHYLKEYVCQICQRFHPGWNQIGTETTRMSCSRPNLLQIPRAAEFRALFVAEPGNLIASLDYSAIEVLVAGVFANEPRLIEACATGDPHLATAQMIMNNPDMTKKSHPDERQMAKIANFGLLFGGGRDGLITQARDLFDVILSPGEAERLMAQYFRLYPGLRGTKDLAYRAMEAEGDRVTVINGVGLRRYLEGFNRKPTSWLNTWIQSTAQAGMKSSFRYLNEAMLTPFILGQVYDEILFEFPEECAKDFAARAKQCMIQGMKDVLGHNIPVVVDVNIGRTWL